MLKLELLWQMESNKRKRSDNTNNTSDNNDNNNNGDNNRWHLEEKDFKDFTTDGENVVSQRISINPKYAHLKEEPKPVTKKKEVKKDGS